MGKIVVKPNRYGVGEDFYVSDSGYRIPVAAKTSRTRSIFGGEADDDYSLEELDFAFAEFNRFKLLMAEKFGDVFVLNEHVNGSRVIDVNCSLEFKHRGVYDSSNFFQFNLQSGKIHNIPVAKMEAASEAMLTVKEKNIFNNYVNSGGVGYDIDNAVKILESFSDSVSDSFSSYGLVMSSADLDAVFSVFTFKQKKQIFGTVPEWVPYIAAGLSLESVCFAFSERLWGSGKTPVPVEQVLKVEGLPLEWAVKLLSNG